MGQCSKRLLCPLIGKAERGAAHTKDLDWKMMALSFLLPLLLWREGTGLQYMFFTSPSVFSFQVSAIIECNERAQGGGIPKEPLS